LLQESTGDVTVGPRRGGRPAEAAEAHCSWRRWAALGDSNKPSASPTGISLRSAAILGKYCNVTEDGSNLGRLEGTVLARSGLFQSSCLEQGYDLLLPVSKVSKQAESCLDNEIKISKSVCSKAWHRGIYTLINAVTGPDLGKH